MYKRVGLVLPYPDLFWDNLSWMDIQKSGYV